MPSEEKLNKETKYIKKPENTNKHKENKVGFVSHAVKFTKTADYNPEISLDRVIHCLETASRQSPPSYKDPLTIATVFPLLVLCREKDYLQDGFLIIGIH